jgi:hypothetical protein
MVHKIEQKIGVKIFNSQQAIENPEFFRTTYSKKQRQLAGLCPEILNTNI